MLRSRYHKPIAVMYEEVSMVGRDLFKRVKRDFGKLWEQPSHLEGCML